MTRATTLPNHLRPRRAKVFGDGDPAPLDGNAKARLMTRARAMLRPTEARKHYGAVTAKTFEVFKALLWGFHNGRSGLCFPSYEAIAAKAGCHRDTVAEAIKALEDAGLLSWVNRIVRTRDAVQDLFGHWVSRWRVIRISNAYRFLDRAAPVESAPLPARSLPRRPWLSSKSEIPSGTYNQDSSYTYEQRKAAQDALAERRRSVETQLREAWRTGRTWNAPKGA